MADALTLSRPFLGVAFFLFAGPGQRSLALALLGLAAATDILDGPLARRAGVGNRAWGVFWDPLCDKLFMGLVVIALGFRFAVAPAWLAVLLLRELLQVASLIVRRIFPGGQTESYDFQSHATGKVTTILQFAAVGSFVLGYNAAAVPLTLVASAAGLAAVSIYIRRWWRSL